MNTILAWRKRSGVCLLMLFWVFWGAAPSVHAHARLVKARPADKSEMAAAPEQIELWFNELLDDGFHSIAVFAAKDISARQRVNLAKGQPVVNGKDRTRLAVALEKLPPGEYIVEWRVLSRDGHSAPGRIRFRVGASR